MSILTKEEFIKVLEAHDWLYAYSDDHKVYTEGKREARVIQELVENDAYLMGVYESFTGEGL